MTFEITIIGISRGEINDIDYKIIEEWAKNKRKYTLCGFGWNINWTKAWFSII
jgi:hypothetical protein